MKFIPLRALALLAMPTFLACASTAPNDSGQNGGSGAKGGTGGTSSGNTGGTSGGNNGGTSGGSTGGTTGSTGGTSGGDAGGTAAACGKGKTAAKGAIIEDFDGMSQVLEWDLSDSAHLAGKASVQKGQFTVQVSDPMYTIGSAALAAWSDKDRPCMDGSTYSGIQFKVTGNVANLKFQVETPATIPVSEGGTCTSDTQCAYAHYEKDVSAILPAGGVVKVPFADLKPAFGSPAAFDKSALVVLVFITRDGDTTKSFVIDDVAFY